MANYVAMRRLQPWRSAVAIGASWCGIGVIFALLHVYPRLWLGLILAPLLGAFQNRLTALIHEGQHRLLHDNPKINDLICAWLCSYPLGNFDSLSRKLHLRHHAAFGRHGDPNVDAYTVDLKTFKRQLRRSLLGFPLVFTAGWSLLRNMTQLFRGKFAYSGSKKAAERERDDPGVWHEYVSIVLIQCSFLGLSYLTGDWWAYPLWLWARSSFCNSYNMVRLFTEHHSPRNDAEPILVNVKAGWLERFFIGPLNFHHHGTHHLATYLPFYQLPQLTALVVQDRAELPFVWKSSYLAYAVGGSSHPTTPPAGKAARDQAKSA